jgi:hypothetical protein
MKWWAMGPAGEPVRQYIDSDLRPLGPNGWATVLIDGRPETNRWRIAADGAAIEPLPVDVSELRALRWEAAKAYRDEVIASGCMGPNGRVDADDKSLVRILGAIKLLEELAGTDPAPAINWTMQDNSEVPHDLADMRQMGIAVGLFIDACQSNGNAIRRAINAADDPANIDITAGYPAQEAA